MKSFIIVAISFFLSIPFSSRAQWGMGKPEEITAFKNRKLIVLVEKEDPKVIDKLTRKKRTDMIPVYKDAIAKFNENMKATVEKVWTMHKPEDILYKTLDEVNTLYKSKSKSYSLLYVESISATHLSAGPYAAEPGLDWTYTDVKNGDQEEDDTYWGNATYLRTCLIEDFHKIALYQIGLPNTFPTPADITFGIENTNYYFDYRSAGTKTGEVRDMIKENAGLLKTLTLHMRSSDVDPKTTEQTLKSAYPYQLVFDSDADFDNVVTDRTEGVAYTVIIPVLTVVNNAYKTYYIPYTSQASDGKVLSVVEPSVGASMLASQSSLIGKIGKNVITEKDISKIVSDVSKSGK